MNKEYIYAVVCDEDNGGIVAIGGHPFVSLGEELARKMWLKAEEKIKDKKISLVRYT